MNWILLLAIVVLAYQQYRNHRALVALVEDINTDVDTIVADRRNLQNFIRARVTERIAEFKTGGGRERIRERLRQKALAAAEASAGAGPAHGVPTSPATE